MLMNAVAMRAAFVDELSKANRKLRTLFDARVRTYGLTLSRARLLMHLANADGATQTELADALEVEQPSIVGLIDALEKKGLIERRVVEGDRRSRAIFLTEAARREADEILAFACALRRQVLKDVDEKDLKIATCVLQQVTRNIGSAVCAPAAGSEELVRHISSAPGAAATSARARSGRRP